MTSAIGFIIIAAVIGFIAYRSAMRYRAIKNKSNPKGGSIGTKNPPVKRK